MAYDSEVLRAATAELNRRRRRREGEQERKKREIYAALPEVAEIDRQLRETMLEIASSALRRGTDPGPAIAVIRDKNLQLQQRRKELLLRAGYREEDLEEAPLCPHCGDTGWVGAEMCACLRGLCAKEQIRQLSSMIDLGEQSFDRFDLELYSAQPDPATGISPRENMELIYELCLGYARRFGRFYYDNLLLSGGTGLGKTFLSACIAREVSESGFSVVYDTAVHVFARFDREKFSRDAEENRAARSETRRYLSCDLLILDDLGSEMTTPLVQSSLYTIVNTRLTGKKHTVINTNLGLNDLRGRYSPQVLSRLEGEYHHLRFAGEDIRLLKKNRM